MKDSQKEVMEICKSIIEEQNLFLIDIIFRGSENKKIIEIFVDAEYPFTIDHCVQLSKTINEVIESRQLIGGDYRLDVSSPGVERSLIYIGQYKKHINRYFEIEYIDNTDESLKKFKAKLLRIEENNLIFEFKSQEITIDFINIKKAKVVITF